MDSEKIRLIVEGALLAAGKALDIKQLEELFDELGRPPRDQISAALEEIEDSCAGRGFMLYKTGGGYRFQVRQELAPWVNRLWEEKPQRYSRALLETLAIIAYRQPITRGDIEEIRGVAVSTNITKTLLEREWIRVVGHRDVPGRPSLYATTKQFLDYFSLRSLEELPPLSELKDLDALRPELDLLEEDLPESDQESAVSGEIADHAPPLEVELSVDETGKGSEQESDSEEEETQQEDAPESIPEPAESFDESDTHGR